MQFNLSSLVSAEDLKLSLEAVLKKVDTEGKVIVINNNKPSYIITAFSEEKAEDSELPIKKVFSKHTLQDAMRMILEENEGREMHASVLSDKIYARGLYSKRDGTQAQYNQIRARCGHYPDMFEALPGNFIRLKKSGD